MVASYDPYMTKTMLRCRQLLRLSSSRKMAMAKRLLLQVQINHQKKGPAKQQLQQLQSKASIRLSNLLASRLQRPPSP